MRKLVKVTAEPRYFDLSYFEHLAILNSNPFPLDLLFQSFSITFFKLSAFSDYFSFPLGVRNGVIQLYIAIQLTQKQLYSRI